jgi:nucleotide-binding universal stress UspA family protein
MFQKILVPLDRSARAERAVPIAARIAQTTGGTVVLLHVVHLLVEYAPYLVQAPAFTETALNEELENANAYLARVARSPALEGIKTETEAFFGVEAYTILTFAQASKVDLIVLCSHGRTGFKRWALGSVAQKIVRHSTAPVLLLREGAPESRLSASPAGGMHPLRALVALDGSPAAEVTLIPAAHLVAALGASLKGKGELHLISVVKLPGDHDDMSRDHALKERAEYEATTYLGTVASRLRDGPAAEFGLKVTYAVVLGEDVADALIRAAELGEDTATFQACDLLAMATHGRSGFERWMLGSITERVLNGTNLPLLIVRPAEQHGPVPDEQKEAKVNGHA